MAGAKDVFPNALLELHHLPLLVNTWIGEQHNKVHYSSTDGFTRPLDIKLMMSVAMLCKGRVFNRVPLQYGFL